MNVLDLFCGLKGFSQAFEDRGHEVFTVDIEEKFNPDLCIDINNLDPGYFEPHLFDVILASPPCQCFSIASVFNHWDNGIPRKETREAIRLVSRTLYIILNLYPRFWILENPMCMMRRVLGKPPVTITQCQYGETRMKPTDLWGVFPKSFKPKRCKNLDKCHERSPRGSKTSGTQGIKNRELRAKIPYGLSEALCVACEKEIKK